MANFRYVSHVAYFSSGLFCQNHTQQSTGQSIRRQTYRTTEVLLSLLHFSSFDANCSKSVAALSFLHEENLSVARSSADWQVSRSLRPFSLSSGEKNRGKRPWKKTRAKDQGEKERVQKTTVVKSSCYSNSWNCDGTRMRKCALSCRLRGPRN